MITKMAIKFWKRVAKDPGLLTRTIKNMAGISGDINPLSGGARQGSIILSKIDSSPELGKKFFRQRLLKETDSLRDVPVSDKLKRWSYIKADDGTYGRMLLPEESTKAINDALKNDSSANMVLQELNKVKDNTTKSLNFVTGSSTNLGRREAGDSATFKVLSGRKVPFYHSTDSASAKGLINTIHNKGTIGSPSSIAQATSYSNIPIDKNLFAYPQRNNSIRMSKDNSVVKGEVPLRDVLFGPETSRSYLNSKPMPEMIINEKALHRAKILPGKLGI